MRNDLRFNRDTVQGQAHIIASDRGTFWHVTGVAFNHYGEQIGWGVKTFNRDVLAHQFIASMVTILNTDISS